MPTYISPLRKRRGWKVRLNLTQPPTNKHFGDANTDLEVSLINAWIFVVDTLQSDNLRPPKTKPLVNQDLFTGVVGVRLTRKHSTKKSTPFLLRVSQSLSHEKAYNVTFYSIREHSLRRESFERQYRLAIAARRYYEFLRLKHYRLDKPITPSTTIPREFYPETLPVPDLYDRLIGIISDEK